jgi:hypothetical protein
MPANSGKFAFTFFMLAAANPAFGASPEGCANQPQAIPQRAIEAALPEVIQPYNYSCEVAWLLSIITYYGLENEKYAELREELGASKANGTDFRRIVKFANKHGLNAHVRRNMDLDALNQ